MSAPPGRNLIRHALLALLAASPASSVPLRLPTGEDRILVIRPDHLGDVLFVTPALRKLRTAFPKANITCLVGPWAAAIIERNTNVDEVIYSEFPWFDGQPPSSPLHPYVRLFRLARELRRRGFDIAVNLRFDFWWGAAASHLARIPYRIGYGTLHCRRFLHAALPYLSGRHEVDQNLALIDHLVHRSRRRDGSGVEPASCHAPYKLEFQLTSEERKFADRYLATSGVGPDESLLIIHPGTRAAIKQWPAERFAEVGTVLSSRLSCRVLLSGNRQEKALTAAIAARMPVPPIDAAGDTTVGQMAALLERAALVLGVDSGPLHLASALEVPSVRLYGPTDHVAFGPYGDPARNAVVRAGFDCSPCHRLDYRLSEMPAHFCMQAITVEQVLRAAQRVVSLRCSNWSDGTELRS